MSTKKGMSKPPAEVLEDKGTSRYADGQDTRTPRFSPKYFFQKTATVLAMLVIVAIVAVAVILSGTGQDEIYLPEAAVSLDSAVCADLAAGILDRGGSAVEAAITGMLCSGVVQPASSGIGGGGFMTIRLWNSSVYVLNFRETAPMTADENIFNGNSTSRGGLSVAVPGEVIGMERAHQLFGRLEWWELFDPVIDLARNGHKLTKFAAYSLQVAWDDLPENIRAQYRNETGGMKVEGDLVTFPELADTLEAISQNGTDAFYADGRIAQSIVDTVSASGGIMTLEDLHTYTVREEEPLRAQYDGNTFYTPPSPSGGPVFLFMLSLMDLYGHDSTSNDSLLYQRLVEVFKFAFAERTRLADPFCNGRECESDSQEILESQSQLFNASYVSEIWSRISEEDTQNLTYYNPRFSPTQDAGTSHISVLSSSGDAVSVTTSVNSLFGSKLMTDTGIVLNNAMDDFSVPNIRNEFALPPSNINFIRPGKRPLSSACPTIGVSDYPDFSLMVIGASGGTKILTSVTQAVIQFLTLEQELPLAIDSKRLHHQLLPDIVFYEENFPVEVLQFLEERGHNISSLNPTETMGIAVQGIYLDGNDCVTAHADHRKCGKSVILNPDAFCS